MHTKVFLIISWLLLLGVMTGGLGYTKLSESWTKFQSKFFKLGHAHGGVMLMASILYYRYIVQTDFSGTAKNWLAGLFLLGALAVASGFFWHAFVDKREDKHSGIVLLAGGYLAVTVAVLGLVYGLWQL